jgi:hypothetical protein
VAGTAGAIGRRRSSSSSSSDSDAERREQARQPGPGVGAGASTKPSIVDKMVGKTEAVRVTALTGSTFFHDR